MLIATKYGEIYPPLLKDFEFISDKNCSAAEILEMERKILMAVDFDIQLTSSFRFLERFTKLSKIDTVTFFLSQYMLELGLLDSKMNLYRPSLQAVSAIYTAKKYLNFYNHKDVKIPYIMPELELETEYTDANVKDCAKVFD